MQALLEPAKEKEIIRLVRATSVNSVSVTNTQMSEISTYIASLTTHVKNQDNCLKLMISKQMADKSDSDDFFSNSEGDSEGTNRNNGSLVCGKSSQLREGETSDMLGPPLEVFCV